MYGQNPKRPPVKGDGTTLAVQDMFSTFQGEGPFAGMPSVFIRLGGCNLACSFCDTEFESFKDMLLEDVITQACALRRPSAVRLRGKPAGILAVITGGEPMRQPIARLCEHLLQAGFTPQIETNGTLFQELPCDVSIVCSPKNTGHGYYPIRSDIRARIHAYKFLISADDPLYTDIPDWAFAEGIPVYVQPIDTEDAQRNRLNYRHTARIAAEKGCMLGIQMHKFYHIP